MRGIFPCLCAVLVALLAVATQDRSHHPEASTALRMDLTQLVAGADLVLEGRVVSTTPLVAADGLVHTEIQLLVERTYWGEHLGLRTLRLPGGVLPDGHGTVVPGMPRLTTGQDVVLVLSAETHLGSRVVCGLAQGHYSLLRDARGRRLAVRSQASATFDPTAEFGALVPGGVGAAEVLEYAELVARLESAVAERSARERAANGEQR